MTSDYALFLLFPVEKLNPPHSFFGVFSISLAIYINLSDICDVGSVINIGFLSIIDFLIFFESSKKPT